jgi:uncharacterized lipoprotein YddW (UPF0748 family)
MLVLNNGQAQPKHEVRGVWLTTLLGLDWPDAAARGNPQMQKASLKRIIEDIARMNLNTVFFQVRSRGNAMYRSAYEPWAAELTGTLGDDPGWDPLAFAIEECHAHGIELHAWVNTSKVWQGGGSPPLVRPGHIVRLHPEWVEKYKDEFWLDPGIPAAREYTAAVIADMVSRYDLDGIHLDYVRYPETDFNDRKTYLRYGNGADKADWRRDNINMLVKLIYDRTTALKPGLKVGSAPIGIYRSLPTAKGWEGYTRLAQDSRRWLRDGYQDYVVPQVYWGLRNRGSNIDYQALVHDWKSNASGRHVYIGTAAYRPEVQPWLAEHIDVCRSEHADGIVFFRYAFLKSGQMFHGRFTAKALPPPMTWRDASPPAPPMNFAVDAQQNGIRLTWQPANERDLPRRYVIYKSMNGPVDIGNPAQILAILPGGIRAYTDLKGTASVRYTVTALDAMNNESDPAIPGAIAAAPRAAETPVLRMNPPALAAPLQYGGNLILIGYNVNKAGNVRLRLLDDEREELYVLINEYKTPGAYIIGVERSRMPGSVAICELATDGTRITRTLAN